MGREEEKGLCFSGPGAELVVWSPRKQSPDGSFCTKR